MTIVMIVITWTAAEARHAARWNGRSSGVHIGGFSKGEFSNLRVSPAIVIH